MPRVLPVRALGLAAGLVGTVAAGVTGSQQFRSGVDVVRLPVVVSDRHGTIVSGLTRDDFSVFEDGRPQDLAFFSEGPPGEAVPLHLGLLLDASSSMELNLREATNAAVRFVNYLDEATDVTFIDFDSSIRLGQFSPASYPMLFERIRAQEPGGQTALYDAVGVYLESSLRRPGQHILLLYSDGGDTASSITFGRLQQLLQMTDVLVYAIGYLDQRGSARALQQIQMTQIARQTGGEAYFPVSGEGLDDVYDRILGEITGRYTLGYVPRERPEAGDFRRVEVRVTRPDLSRLRIRTRPGYQALEVARR